jgi:hypothetical protein
VWNVQMRRSKGGFRCRGHAEIQRSLDGQSAVRTPALHAEHIVVDPRIAVSVDDATARSYFLRVEPRDDGPTRIVASGRYVDRLVRCEDGRWLFRERGAEIDDP